MSQEPGNSAGSRIVLLLTAYWLLVLSYTWTAGRYQLPCFFMALGAVILLSLSALGWERRILGFLGNDARFALGISVLMGAVLGVIFYYTPYCPSFKPCLLEYLFCGRGYVLDAAYCQNPNHSEQLIEFWTRFEQLLGLGMLALGANAVLMFLFLAHEPTGEGALPRAMRWVRGHRFWVALALVLFARIAMLQSSPNPSIDVFFNTNQGAEVFMQGENPYAAKFTQVYQEEYQQKVYGSEIKDYYPYLPGVLLITTPFRALFQDARYAYLVLEILAALMLVKLAVGLAPEGSRDKARRLGELVALTYLFNPRGPFIIEECWVEPMLVALLTLFTFFHAVKKKPLAAAFFAGLALATKQYMVLLPVFMLRLKKQRMRLLGWCFIIAGVIILPFALWNFKEMWNDTVRIFLMLPPRYEAITLWTFLQRSFSLSVPMHGPMAMGVGLLPVALGAAIAFGKQRPGAEGVLGALAVALLWSFFFSKQAFINYYYLVSSILLAQVAILVPQMLAQEEPLPEKKGARELATTKENYE